MLGLFCSYCVLCRWVVGDLLKQCLRFFYTELCREFGVSYSTFALLIYFTANRSEKHLKKNLLFFSFPLLRGFLTLSHTIDTECEKIHNTCHMPRNPQDYWHFSRYVASLRVLVKHDRTVCCMYQDWFKFKPGKLITFRG